MFSKIKPFLLHAISSVHAGSGSELGIVDLPIQREKHTGYPKIDSSSLKGAIRSTFRAKIGKENEDYITVFGNEAEDKNNTISGAISFSDARILLFPIRSMRGVFAWVTCPYILERFNQENEAFGTGIDPLPVPEQNIATASSDKLLLGDKKQQIMLEEYTFSIQENKETKELAEKISSMISGTLAKRIKDHLIVLPNDDFTNFALLSTEVNARIHINPTTGIVDKGALWYEENVPPETFFYCYLFAGEPRREQLYNIKNSDDVLQFMMNEDHFPEVFQLGGNSTLGRGLLRRIWLEGSK